MVNYPWLSALIELKQVQIFLVAHTSIIVFCAPAAVSPSPWGAITSHPAPPALSSYAQQHMCQCLQNFPCFSVSRVWMGFFSHSSLVLISLMDDTHRWRSQWSLKLQYVDYVAPFYSLTWLLPFFKDYFLPPPTIWAAAHLCLCWLVLIFLPPICFPSALTLGWSQPASGFYMPAAGASKSLHAAHSCSCLQTPDSSCAPHRYYPPQTLLPPCRRLLFPSPFLLGWCHTGSSLLPELVKHILLLQVFAHTLPLSVGDILPCANMTNSLISIITLLWHDLLSGVSASSLCKTENCSFSNLNTPYPFPAFFFFLALGTICFSFLLAGCRLLQSLPDCRLRGVQRPN